MTSATRSRRSTSASRPRRPATRSPAAGGCIRCAWIRAAPGCPRSATSTITCKFGLWHDCLYMGANEFTRAGKLRRRPVRVVQPRGSVQRRAAHLRLGYLPGVTHAFTLIPSNNQGTARTRRSPERRTTSCPNRASAFAFEVRKFTAGPNCGAGGIAERADERQPGHPTRSSQGADRPAAEHDEQARHDRRPDHAEGAVPQDRRRGVAVGHASGRRRRHERQDRPAVGAARRHRRHDRDHAGAAADLCAGHVALSLHGQPCSRHQGNMALGYRTSNGTSRRTSRASPIPAGSRAIRSTRCRRPRCSSSQARARRPTPAAARPAIAGATTPR